MEYTIPCPAKLSAEVIALRRNLSGLLVGTKLGTPIWGEYRKCQFSSPV